MECENLGGIGVEVNGAFAEYIKLRSNLVFPIDKLSFRQAVMIEPTACACHGMEVLAMKPGSNVLLMGAGPTGQVVGQLLKLNGASHLTVAAPAGPKLDLRSCGFPTTFQYCGTGIIFEPYGAKRPTLTNL